MGGGGGGRAHLLRLLTERGKRCIMFTQQVGEISDDCGDVGLIFGQKVTREV